MTLHRIYSPRALATKDNQVIEPRKQSHGGGLTVDIDEQRGTGVPGAFGVIFRVEFHLVGNRTTWLRARAAMLARARWLERVARVLSAEGISSSEIEVREYQDSPRTVVVVRGEPRFDWVLKFDPKRSWTDCFGRWGITSETDRRRPRSRSRGP